MLKTTSPLIAAASALFLSCGAPALAQDAAAPAAPDAAPAQIPDPNQLQTGEPAENDIGSTYVASTHGDWSVRCVRTADGQDPCQLYQLLKDDQGNSVAEFSLFALPAGQQAAAGATIITPLETLLTQQITLQVDEQAARRYPFSWCAPVGCIARVGFTQPELDQMKRGNAAVMTIVPVAAPDQQVRLTVSLRGFTAGFDAVEAANRN